jgi:hypothetical protein
LTELGGVFPRLSGFLRSSHALVALVALLCLGFFAFGRPDPVITYGSFGLFVVLALAVIFRYAMRGPEVDRSQTVVAISHQAATISNVDLSQLTQGDLIAVMQAVINPRSPLPPPTGLIRGDSSDLHSIEHLDPAQAKVLADEDNAALTRAIAPPAPDRVALEQPDAIPPLTDPGKQA